MTVKTIIEELEELRAELDLSQEKMARKLNVSLRTYQKWIKGRSKPSADNLLKIQQLIEA